MFMFKYIVGVIIPHPCPVVLGKLQVTDDALTVVLCQVNAADAISVAALGGTRHLLDQLDATRLCDVSLPVSNNK